MENGGEESELQEINSSKESTSVEEGRTLTKRERRLLAKEKKRTLRLRSGQAGKLKKWGIRTLIFIAVVFGGYKFWQWMNTPQVKVSTSEILNVRSDDWVKGDSSAKVTLIEYADFECPACAQYLDILDRLGEEYNSDLRIVYRHFPLPQHTKAIDTAKAAEAAGFQGKFWEMNSLLYERQDEWIEEGNIKERLIEYANELGLEEGIFIEDYDSDEISKSIKQDEADALTLRVNQTPTFFINGKKVISNNGYGDLKEAIDQAVVNTQ